MHLPEKYRLIFEVLYWCAGRIREVPNIRVRNLVPDHIREGALNARARVEEAYPSEVNALSDNWDHGFNSGCLAAFRYVQTALQQDLATAEREFPDLDT